MEYITTKSDLLNNAVIISFCDFLAIYDDAPWNLEGVQLYLDGSSVTVLEYDDYSVTLESTFNIQLCD